MKVGPCVDVVMSATCNRPVESQVTNTLSQIVGSLTRYYLVILSGDDRNRHFNMLECARCIDLMLK